MLVPPTPSPSSRIGRRINKRALEASLQVVTVMDTFVSGSERIPSKGLLTAVTENHDTTPP